MSLLSWFDMAGRVSALTVQLAGRTGELRAAHKTIEYWKQIAGSRYDEIHRLNADINEARAAATSRNARDLIPPPVSVPLGSRDRANAQRLAAENAELRQQVEDLHRKLEGHPS